MILDTTINITLDEFLLLLGTIAMFAQGYCVRRKYFLGTLASTFLAIFQLVIGIFMKGIEPYRHVILYPSISNFLIAITFTVFWWIFGYIVGGIIPKTSKKEPENISTCTTTSLDIWIK